MGKKETKEGKKAQAISIGLANSIKSERIKRNIKLSGYERMEFDLFEIESRILSCKEDLKHPSNYGNPLIEKKLLTMETQASNIRREIEIYSIKDEE